MFYGNSKSIIFSVIAAVLSGAAVFAVAGTASAAWSSGEKFAYSENAGWLNASTTHETLTVSGTGITGYMWGENIGWIKFDYDGEPGADNTSATNWGVVNDCAGNLSGYAWGENIGWINFNPTHDQVRVSSTTGQFSGNAWAENIGWIEFGHYATDNIMEWNESFAGAMLTLSNHTLGQVTNQWTGGVTGTTSIHYRYSLAPPAGESTSLGETIIDLSSITGVIQSDITGIELYIDYDHNGSIFTNNPPSIWTTLNTGASAYSMINAMIYDSAHDVLYAGGANGSGGGDILRCPNASTGNCDEAADWTVLDTSSGYDSINSMVYDSYNDVLYAGTGYSAGDGDILRCPNATTGNCDQASDWTALDTSGSTYEAIYAMIYDPINDVLYAGAGNGTGDGDILRCPNATTGNCDQASDWTALDTGGSTYGGITSFTYDSTNDVLYAGTAFTPGDGDILRCPNATTGNCDQAADWTALDTSVGGYDRIESMVYDSINNVLYASTGYSTGDGNVLRCPNASTGNCDQASDWTVLDPTGPYEAIKALSFNSAHNFLYAGAGSGTGDGDVIYCPNASTGNCDQSADWTAIDTGGSTYELVNSLVFDSGNNILYAGTGSGVGDGDIIRMELGDALIIGQVSISDFTGAFSFATSSTYSISTTTDFILELTVANLGSSTGGATTPPFLLEGDLVMEGNISFEGVYYESTAADTMTMDLGSITSDSCELTVTGDASSVTHTKTD